MKFKKPETKEDSFTCPHCGVFAMQNWSPLMTQFYGRGGWFSQQDMDVGLCDSCKKITLWFKKNILFPNTPNVPLPNDDLNLDIKKDYNEAAEIVEKSPRAAAALLRVAIEKLCQQLGQEEKDLNTAIGNLVKNGLSVKVKKALDIVRVIGNESVHPGQINISDDKETAYRLFELVNIIADTMITQPNEIDNLYNSLPQEKLEGIKNRDI